MTAADVREADSARSRIAPLPPLAVLFWPPRPWWLFDPADFPGYTRKQIAAGLAVPAIKTGIAP